MPFGLSLKSFIIGLLFAYFVLPFLMGLTARASSKDV